MSFWSGRQSEGQRQALDWIVNNVSPASSLVTDASFYVDLHNTGRREQNPAAVAPFHAPNAPLIERNPVRFYKALSVLLLIGNAILLWLLVARQTP